MKRRLAHFHGSWSAGCLAKALILRLGIGCVGDHLDGTRDFILLVRTVRIMLQVLLVRYANEALTVYRPSC
jgi:hypothetical protein